MEYMQQAYEALVVKLKDELEEARKSADRQMFKAMAAEEILMDFIAKNQGKKVLMELAKEIDKKHGEENNYTQMVEHQYED